MHRGEDAPGCDPEKMLPYAPGPNTVVEPYRYPSDPCNSRAYGIPPSCTEKEWTTVKSPVGVILKTEPALPPYDVVPQKFPSVACMTPPYG